MIATREANPGKTVEIWFQDEARVGNKGRVAHRWWTKGQRAPGLCDRRFTWTYIFSAIHPETGRDFTYVMPHANAEVMQAWIEAFALTIPEGVHILMVLDGAGWHDARALNLPENITLLALPPYSPELNPVERVWLYLRERYLSFRVLDTYEEIEQACCDAWNQLVAQPHRIKTLTDYPWIKNAIS